jgi:DNA-binding GntR family transcriptional regulator
MQSFPQDRPNLSEDLAGIVREMIFDGRLPAGLRINEVRLAAQLGVSRTPLREALATLLVERALTAVPRRGFFVQELTAEEVKNVYPMRAILDPEALRLSGIPPAKRIKKLEDIAGRLQSTNDVKSAIRLDDEWFRALWADCTNPVLVELIEHFMRRTRRYELAAMRERENVTASSRSKIEVVELLRAGKLSGACKRVRKSLNDGAEPVLEWLARRKTQTPAPKVTP